MKGMKMIGIFVFLICVFSFILIIRGDNMSLSATQEELIKNLYKNGVRAYWIYPSGGDMELARKSGLNVASIQYPAAYYKDTSSRPPIKSEEDLNPDAVKQMKEVVKKAKKAGIIPLFSIYTLNGAMAQEIQKHNFSPFVDERGFPLNPAPCPRDRRFWFELMLPQWTSVARALQEEDWAGGITMENEFYATASLGWWYPKYRSCYCDSCFNDFLKTKKIKIEKLPDYKERANFITKNGLDKEYYQFMESEIAGIFKEMTGKVRKICPAFLVAQYPYISTPFCNGVIEGAGTEKLPVILFSNDEYFSGFRSFSEKKIEELKFKKYNNVLYAGGLSIGYYNPVEYAMNALKLLQFADGFWIYWGGCLFDANWKQRMPGSPDYEKISWEYRLQAEPKEYWDALEKVLKSYDSKESLEKSYTKSSLKLVNPVTSKEKSTASIEGENIVVGIKDIKENNLVKNSNFDLLDSWKFSNFSYTVLDKEAGYTKPPSLIFSSIPKENNLPLFYITQELENLSPGEYCLSFCYKTDKPDYFHIGAGVVRPTGWGWYDFYPTRIQPDRWEKFSMIQKIEGSEKILTVHIATLEPTVWVDDINLEKINSVILKFPVKLSSEEELGFLKWEPFNDFISVDIERPDGTIIIKNVYPGMFLTPVSKDLGLREINIVFNIRLTSANNYMNISKPELVIYRSIN